MAATKILLVEDEIFLGQIVKESFETRGFEVQLAKDGEEGLDSYKNNEFDICILDVMLPKMDGFKLAKEIKKLSKTQPIIFLTAKSLTEDVVEGFKIGADDYVRKPFSMEELILRVKAVLGRKSSVINNTMEDEVKEFEIGAYNFLPLKQELNYQGNTRKLTSRESELLKILCLNRNQLVERDSILKELWGDDSYFNARSMDVFITKIRKYLSDDPSVELLNVRGKGYKLIFD